MRVYILPNAAEITTLHCMKALGWSLTTVRRKNGESLNVAEQVPVLTNVVQLKPKKEKK